MQLQDAQGMRALASLGLALLLAGPAAAMGETYLAKGEGLATFAHPPGAADQCPAMLAQVEWHGNFSNEPVLTTNFVGGQGAPLLMCGSGWRFTFKPTEVQGTPMDGLSAYRLSPDAEIWLTLTAPDGEGNQSLQVTQITILNDVLTFDGHVTRIA